jgi:hypothetical protein
MSTPTTAATLDRDRLLEPASSVLRPWAWESGTWLIRKARRHRLGDIVLLLLSLAALVSALVLSCSP